VDAGGAVWTMEHGTRGGDELNRPQAGRNYGWPVIAYGVEYSGQPIGDVLIHERAHIGDLAAVTPYP